MAHPEELLHSLRDRAGSSVVAIDFDGTLAPIVEDPAAAVPAPGAVELLERLSRHFASVTVVSGRPLSFIGPFLPRSIDVVALYGLEGRRDGERWEYENSGAWRETLGDVAATAESHGPEGMRVELKDLSITLHYRGTPELAGEVEAYAVAQAERAGLLARPARMSWELHPPIDVDKGSALRGLAEGRTGILYAGDDVGDLPAFEVLGELRRAGLTTVAIGVDSDEAPEALGSATDLVVSGTPALLEVLETLEPVG